MTLDQFRASHSNELPAQILEDVSLPDGAIPHVYASEWLIHEHAGKFWVHAWWYAPLPYGTIAEAEEKLYAWYQELS